MGQSSSSAPKEEEDFTSYASTSELQALDQILGGPNLQFQSLTGNLKNRLLQFLPDDVSSAFLSLLQEQCQGTSKPAAKLRQEICRISFGMQHERMSFLFRALTTDKPTVDKAKMRELLMSSIKCLHSVEAVQIFGTNETALSDFCSFLFAGKDALQEDDFHSVLQTNPFVADLLTSAIRFLFFNAVPEISKDLYGNTPCLLPKVEYAHHKPTSESTVLSSTEVMYLNSHLPMRLQLKWRFLYSTRFQGESFSKLSSQIVKKGPLLVVVKDQGGHVFGGFVSSTLTYSSKFQGSADSFLFTLHPKFEIHNASGFNDHYVYFNTRQETMPNGFGMGGQHYYFGLWLSSEFGKGHCKGKPTCTTYKNPRLSSSEEFEIDTMEAWGLGEEPKKSEQLEDYDEEEAKMSSVIDKHPDVVAMLRVAGRERVSEGYRDCEMSGTMPETTALHPPNDPMEQ